VAGGKQVDVGVTLKGWTSIVFQVKTDAKAGIRLAAEPQNFTDNAFYALDIGADGNTRVVIR